MPRKGYRKGIDDRKEPVRRYARTRLSDRLYTLFVEDAGLRRLTHSKPLRAIVELHYSGKPMPRVKATGASYAVDPQIGYAFFPARGLYRNGTVAAFEEFHLRRRAELDALKLYFLFASRRDRKTNLALITYDTITAYSGVPQNRIKPALTILAANVLVLLDQIPSRTFEGGIANAYRLAHLQTRQHMGTTNRGADPFDLIQPH